MVGPFAIERAHIQRMATHASSPQLQHCNALLATILPLLFPEFRFFSVGAIGAIGDIAMYLRLLLVPA